MKTAVWFGAAIFLYASNVSFSRSIADPKSLSGQTKCTCSETVQISESGDMHAQVGDGLPHVLRIGAFNIKTFGKSKMSDAEVADYITQVRTTWLLLYNAEKTVASAGIFSRHASERKSAR